MISEEERRRAVAELREASTGAYRHVDSLDVIAGAVGVEVAGKFSHDVENEAYAALADFIDRPTCEDATDFNRESFKCSRCGYRVLSIGGKPDDAKLVAPEGGVIDFGFCPNCGAEVIDEDSAN